MRRDGRVDLEQGQVARHVGQPGRARGIQQLRAGGDAVRVRARKLADRHGTQAKRRFIPDDHCGGFDGFRLLSRIRVPDMVRST